jgi:predicted acyl esterase
MIVIDKNVMVPMTDGVRLATDVFRLQEAPPSPVRLVAPRTARIR